MADGTVFQLPQEMQPLLALKAAKGGPADYYLSVRNSDDPYIAVGAWRALLDGRHLVSRDDLWPELVAMCRYGGVRGRAFEFFEREVFEHRLARQVTDTTAASAGAAVADGMKAALSFEAAVSVDATSRQYLATADLRLLDSAIAQADVAGGWRVALPWALRLVLINPSNWGFHLRVFDILRGGSRPQLMRDYARAIREWSARRPVAHLFEAAAALAEGEATECLRQLAALDGELRTDATAIDVYRAPMLRLKAEAQEKTGQFQPAYRDFAAMNAAEARPGIDPRDFFVGAAAKKLLGIPPLPPDNRTDVVQMLGFPRSGTTLLENVLAAHPQIETFEEIPALRAATEGLEAMLTGARVSPAGPIGPFLAMRERYYAELDRFRRKTGAQVLVDKLPLRSSEAGYLSRLFPSWRYIFSIRHPFDVVLSCFKQTFAANTAMENFRSIEGTVRMYDFTMNEWFSVHTMDDPNVHYVRYDDLVTDFGRVTSGVLAFLELEWDDAVNDFAAAAEKRQARTPSYGKVRQGLGIGVQTYWRNYPFVFQSEVAKPLHKWATFFGYETH